MTNPTKFNHYFTFNPKQNDGEQVILHTTFERMGETREGKADDSIVFATQELILNSYTSSAHFNFDFLLNPTRLRHLANQLEEYEANVLTALRIKKA